MDVIMFTVYTNQYFPHEPVILFVQVDCTEDGKDSCSRFGVSGYPTLKIFRGGELSSDYNGPREASEWCRRAR